jgi:hypothetical protein
VRQFEQGKRVASCFRQDALENLLVEGAGKSRPQECACVRRPETLDGKARETVEITRNGSSTEQERDAFRPHSTSHDGERLSRLSIKPLSVVNDTENGVLGSQPGQQAQEGQAHEQPVGCRAGNMPERRTKSFSLGCWQLVKRGQAMYAELLSSGKTELILGFITDSTQHPESGGRVYGVAQQGGLPDSGLTANNDRAAVTGARSVQDPVEYLAFVSSPAHHRRGLA